MADIVYKFYVTLFSVSYDENERECENVYGFRTHVGTEDSAAAFARRTRTKATIARIERIAVHGGAEFRSHEIKSFTIGLN